MGAVVAGAPILFGRSQTCLRELGTKFGLRRETSLHIANLAIGRRIQLVVRHFDLELLRLLQQELFVDHRVERLQLVVTTLCRIGGRLHAPLLILEQTLAKIEARDRLIANDADDPIERGTRHWRLRRQRRGDGREEGDSEISGHTRRIPLLQ